MLRAHLLSPTILPTRFGVRRKFAALHHQFCHERRCFRTKPSNDGVARLTIATSRPRALILGLNSPSSTGHWGSLPQEKTREIIAFEIEKLEEHGLELDFVQVDPNAPLEDTTRMVRNSFELSPEPDCVQIGAAVRVYPENQLLFEELVNIVRECAPNARIVFNSKAGDISDTIIRGLGRSDIELGPPLHREEHYFIGFSRSH